MADLHGILVRPMITEKSSQAWQDRQEYVFEVHPEATKDQIKAAILNNATPTPSVQGKVATKGRLNVETF